MEEPKSKIAAIDDGIKVIAINGKVLGTFSISLGNAIDRYCHPSMETFIKSLKFVHYGAKIESNVM